MTHYPDTVNLLPYQGEVYFFPGFFSQEESSRYFTELSENIEWKQAPIKIMGKEILQPRLTAWHSDKGIRYKYSGITMEAREWTTALHNIKHRIESISGVQFNGVLLNRYRDGRDSMGWHRDNEKMLGTNPVVGSVTLGSTRTFQFRNYQNKKITRTIELTDGSLLMMQGETQHFWEHRIPRTSKPVGERINLTFRVIK
jgi:alkylated DNA repair dioxygenase AlkB